MEGKLILVNLEIATTAKSVCRKHSKADMLSGYDRNTHRDVGWVGVKFKAGIFLIGSVSNRLSSCFATAALPSVSFACAVFMVVC